MRKTVPSDSPDLLTITAPERIWLQVDTEDDDRSQAFPSDHDGVTWCQDSICGAEVEYVRADLIADVLRRDASEVDRLRETLTELRDRIKNHPAYADLTEAQEMEVGGDTAELSYLARVCNAALGPIP